MRGSVLEFDDLKAATGYQRLADVEKCLERNRIRFFRGRDGIWTTLDLVNAAGGISASSANDKYDAELAG